MTDLTHYEKGYSPSAIQRKYSLTYEQGYELAERLRKTQELELEVRRENAQLKELLKEVLRHELSLKEISELTRKICQALGGE